ncbi:MAG: Pr6Pr family membrane protein [Spirochaetes bacterium]|nr:Pr6Pr family membrane protein [Spirochaetota bacterium]
MPKDRLFAAIWRALTALAGILCVGLMFATSQPGYEFNLFYYFTTQSNLFIIALFVLLTLGTLDQIAAEGRLGVVCHIRSGVQLALTFYITITFLIFALLLSKKTFSMGSASALAMILTHYIVPIMVIADWVLFLPHGEVRNRAAFAWLSYPLAYLAFSLLRAEFGYPSFDRGSRYPYFFIDADALGWGNMAWIIPAFLAGFFLLGAGMIYLDKRIAGSSGRKR